MAAAFVVSRLHTASGKALTLSPPVGAEEALVDLQRRAAYALGVGLLQVRLLGKTGELAGNRVGDAVDADDVDTLSVLLQPPLRAYRHQLLGAWKRCGFSRLCRVKFPASSGVDVNMMPFIMGDPKSLPSNLQSYWPMIEACRLPKKELGKVGFLTVQESDVSPGASQRRQGLHLETPGVLMSEGRMLLTTARWGGGRLFERYQKKKVPWLRLLQHSDGELSESAEASGSPSSLPVYELDEPPVAEAEEAELSELSEDAGYPIWAHKRFEGGIYTASSIAGSTRFWNLRFNDPEEICGALGDLEHLRPVLGPGEFSEADTLYWMSDCTPHESVALDSAAHRQYFRLVTSSVSAWYPQHSTENPLGIKVDPKITRIVPGDKFEELHRMQGTPCEKVDDTVWDVYSEQLGIGTEEDLFAQHLDS
ncbi:unnamed protein product [Durusdinium trenchii]|uniref:Uncharacterized protein n=1 Tax=Durusdinium trenchii TaxID=1381693 RepID=A0ABP0SU19_9DINO